jgi:glycosyltransferase involved in cell wall biosynthesis
VLGGQYERARHFMKIAFVIPSLGMGGAERVLTTLSNAWVAKGWDVEVVTFCTEPPSFKLDSRIRIQSVPQRTKSAFFLGGAVRGFRMIRRLRRLIFKIRPDVVVSFLPEANILTLLSLIGRDFPVVISERSMPALNLPSVKGRIYRRLTYPWADCLVSVSRNVDAYFSWIPVSRRAVIHNPVLPDESMAAETTQWPAGVDTKKKWLVAMGRLHPVKGFDLLLQAWSRVAPEHDGWQLLILGEGELRSLLERQRRDLGIEESVVLTGFVDKPSAILKRAEIFVVSSRFEGLVNSAIEAMACGVPVVSFDCPGGVSEIVRDGMDGILVSPLDAEELARGLRRVMGDDELRHRLSGKAPEVLQRFSLDSVLAEWEHLFDGLKE